MEPTQRTGTTFLGAVLKEIACTPNANFDPEDYRRRVIEPVRQIRQLDEQTGDRDLPEERRREVLETLAAVLDAKGVDPDERADRLSGVASRFGVDLRDDGVRRLEIPYEVQPAGAVAAEAAAGR